MNDSTKKKVKKTLIIILCIILALLIVAVSAFFVLRYMGKKQFHKGDANIKASSGYDIDVDENSVSYNGKDYTLNKDVVSILVLGIDKNSIGTNKGYGKNGQADCIFVAAVNTKTKQIKIIPIKRESMVDVDIYSTAGKLAETKKEQICLSYAYGDTAQKSADNVKLSVSRFLMGINISSYIAIDLDGIGKLSNLVGGVRLNSLETLTFYSSGRKIKEGEDILLKGKEATYYVQYRDEDLEGSSKRLSRQKQFLSALATTAGNQILDNFSKLGDYYNAMQPYTSTDLSFAQITYLASSCITKDIGGALDYKSIEGDFVLGEKWGEFTPDSDSLITTILDVFYIEK